MCGITGFYSSKDHLINKKKLLEMTKTLHHRGPDDLGIYYNNNIGLGHTRLSIIDLTKAGHQPFTSEDKTVVLSFNGEVYNYQILKSELIKAGRSFFSGTDTEVVLKSYLEWGSRSFSKLDGMFAFALWDQNLQKLFLVRDRFGIKPLYYSLNDSGIVFGSEIKAILTSGMIQKQLNIKSLHEYLWFGNSLGTDTSFNNINKLSPGKYAIISDSGIEFHQYWDIKKIKKIKDKEQNAIHLVKKKLEIAVKNHLISDVPVGVFLSGGLDSSIITALASKHYDGKLKTFSVGFDFNNVNNELPIAKKVANYFNTEHNELHISAGDISNTIEALVECHDEPFADAANIPLYLLTKKLKGQIKVVLQGDGGDEIFAGYRRYNILSQEKFWRILAKVSSVPFKIFKSASFHQRVDRFFQLMKENNPALRMAFFLTRESKDGNPESILHSDVIGQFNQYDPFYEYKYWGNEFKNMDPVQKMLFTDCKILLPNTFLEKVDKPTMANSIESRVPLLDNNLSDYVMGLPSTMKVRYGNKKWILKQAVNGLLPSSIIGMKKRGFNVPVDYWLKEPLSEYMQSVLLDPSILRNNLFNIKIIEEKIHQHITGTRNNGFLLWKALNFSLWFNKYISNK